MYWIAWGKQFTYHSLSFANVPVFWGFDASPPSYISVADKQRNEYCPPPTGRMGNFL